MIEKTAERVIAKWLRKGNMARAMRDILPHSGLGREERDKVAAIVHDVVRFKRYYDFIMEKMEMGKSPANYVRLSLEKPEVDAPRDIRYSLSPKLASVTPEEFIPIINREPETTLCINLQRISRERAVEKLRAEGYSAREFIPESAVLTDPSGRYSSLVKDALAIVQDASSQIVAKITASLGDEILDYCAGSGGKSLAMFSLKPDARYYAYDINSRKLDSLRRRADRWGMKIEVLRDKPEDSYEVVLVDAPCSGVGAAARNPEAKYREDFSEFQSLQLEILSDASEVAGSTLVYVVCSYTPQETEEVVERFLNEHGDFKPVELSPQYPEFFRKGRYGYYILAGDIFYISVLRR